MLPLQVLFEDNYLLAVNKPHALVVENESPLNTSLQSLALDYLRSKTKYPQKCFIGVPHRLDRPVSGIIILAKKKSVLKMLADIFSKREVEKVYLAITENRPATDEAELNNWLVKDKDNRKAIIYNLQVKNSLKVILQYKLIAQNKNGSLLQINLITGKFHQIRSQLAHLGCAIVGDKHYGATSSYKETSICLHAHTLSFVHPITNELLKITAPVPDDELWNSFSSTIKEGLNM